MALQSIAQNLLPNPDFEDYNVCPTGYSGFWTNDCVAWSNYAGSPDYFNCNFYGNSGAGTYGEPSAGSGCAEMWALPNNLYCFETLQRESIKGNLVEPIEKCKTYRLTFDLMLDKSGGNFSSDTIGSPCLSFGFTFFNGAGPNFGNNSCGCWSIPPTITLTADQVLVNQYKTFTFDFVAMGNYNQVAIGPVCSDTMFTSACYSTPSNEGPNSAYVNIDNMYLERIDDTQIIADATTICQNDTVMFIENKLDSTFNWQWESNGGVPILSNVDTALFYFPNAGNYSISLFTESDCGMDTSQLMTSIVVHSVFEDVELGAPLLICTDAAYTIPNVSPAINYVWSDYRFGSTRTFNNSGNYIVQASDHFGCHESADTLIVSTFNDAFIFPNPTYDLWKSEGQVIKPNKIELFDAFGRVVLSELNVDSILINTEYLSLEPGEYYLRIDTPECRETIKLINLDH